MLSNFSLGFVKGVQIRLVYLHTHFVITGDFIFQCYAEKD